MKNFALSSVLFGFAGVLLGDEVSSGPTVSRKTPSAQLFQLTNIYTVHFKFTEEQWKALEPTGGSGFGGPAGNRGPGGGPGRVGFGPGNLLGPTVVKKGDTNSDGKITREELAGLATQWFEKWDKEKSGLNKDQVAAGLNEVVEPPRFGPPGGGPGGGRGPGLFLQGREGQRNGLASAMGVEFPTVHSDLEFAGFYLSDVAVRLKGNGTFMMSRGSEKRSLKVDLNEFTKGQKIGEVSKLNFHNNITDASFMNEVMSHRLYREAGVPASRTAYARIYATVTGKQEKKYLGLYSLVENVDNNFAEEVLKSKNGAIFKPVTPAPFTDLGSEWSKYKQTYDPKTELTGEQSKRVIDFCQLVSKASDADFATRLPEFLDLEAFARYMAVTVWLSTLDSLLAVGQNYYVYLHPKTQKFQFIPWDLDHSFGQFGLMGTQEQRERLDIHRPWKGEIKFLERVFAVEAFKKLYLARLEEFNKTLFQPARFQAQVEELARVLRPAVTEEGTVALSRFEKSVAGEGVLPSMLAEAPGTKPPTGDAPNSGAPKVDAPPANAFGMMQPAKPIKTFVEARAKSVANQLAGREKGEAIGDFGGGRGPGGRGGGPGGRGNFLAGSLMSGLDGDKNEKISREEFLGGFAKWFADWDLEKSGSLNEEQLVAGINKVLAPNRGGPGTQPGTP